MWFRMHGVRVYVLPPRCDYAPRWFACALHGEPVSADSMVEACLKALEARP